MSTATERRVDPYSLGTSWSIRQGIIPFLPEISQFALLPIFALSVIRVIRLRLPATAPLGRHLTTQQPDQPREESDAYNRRWRDRRKILQHKNDLRRGGARTARTAIRARLFYSDSLPRLQAQEHAGVPEGVRLDPVQVEELRDALVVRAQ